MHSFRSVPWLIRWAAAAYSPEALHSEFGASFRLVVSEREEHLTPRGVRQAFLYCLCRMDGVAGAASPAPEAGGAASSR